MPPRLHVRDVKGVGDRLDVVGRRVGLRAEHRHEARFHHVAHCEMEHYDHVSKLEAKIGTLPPVKIAVQGVPCDRRLG